MALTSKRRDKLMAEMEQFSTALNLLDDQKQKLQDFLSNVHETLHQERRNHGPLGNRSVKILVYKRALNAL